MSNPTSNFGWQMPTATDLVTDLPADFEVFGQAVDTDFVDLLGGTTGQVLSKTSATDLDFTWINNDTGDITGVTAGTGISGGGTSGTVTVTNDMATTITAAGDIVVGTGSGTYDNLPIGTTEQVLTADTTVSPYKVKWATPSSGSMTQLATGTLSGATVTLSSISGAYKNLYLVLENWQCAATDQPYITLNTDTGSNYDAVTLAVFNNSSVGRADSAQGYISRIGMAGYSHPTGSNGNSFVMTIFDYANTISYKYANAGGAVLLTSGTNTQGTWFGACAWRNTAAVNQMVLRTATGSFGGGTYYLFGVK